MNIYFISGLGADKTVFAKLQLPDFYKVHHLEWIPFRKGESLAGYARRLSAAIDQSQPFGLVGLSLGGMLAAEMLSFLQPRKTIVLSSAPSAGHLPPYLRLLGSLRLHLLVPRAAYRWCHPLAYWTFGIRNEEEKELYRGIVRRSDTVFVQRAIGAILRWKKKDRPLNLVHLHGDRDRLLPLRFARPDITIRGGGHLMVFSKAEELSALLGQLLQE